MVNLLLILFYNYSKFMKGQPYENIFQPEKVLIACPR